MGIYDILKAMILAIDIGGTKTLLCTVDNQNNLLTQTRFATPQDYDEFLLELKKTVESLDISDVSAVGVGVPGILNRADGLIVRLGNLPWKHKPIANDVQAICQKPTTIENDAKLAGLYEAYELRDTYKRALYVTISTGIGIGFTVNGKLVNTISDAGGKGMVFEHNNELFPWERYASGKALFEEFGQRASDIEDPAIWQEVARRLVPGFTALITLLSPDVITIGGGVGAHYNKFEHIFEPLLESYLVEGTKKPDILMAKNAEEAVVYGAALLARDYEQSL